MQEIPLQGVYLGPAGGSSASGSQPASLRFLAHYFGTKRTLAQSSGQPAGRRGWGCQPLPYHSCAWDNRTASVSSLERSHPKASIVMVGFLYLWLLEVYVTVRYETRVRVADRAWTTKSGWLWNKQSHTYFYCTPWTSGCASVAFRRSGRAAPALGHFELQRLFQETPSYRVCRRALGFSIRV